LQKYFLTGIGGFLGAVARLWIGTIIDVRLGTKFPYGTFIVNLTGCFLIGVILTILDERLNMNPAWRYLLPVGFIGAYTTFSTFEYEILLQFQNGEWQIPLLYVTLSVFMGFACVWIGAAIGRSIA
jgi:fluoride exporter